MNIFDRVANKYQQYSIDIPYFSYDYCILDENIKIQRGSDIQILRGPIPSRENLDNGNYFITIGSAHTFGRFSNKCYGQYLSELLGISYINAGVSDSSPALFCDESWLKYINNAKFAVVQFMSGRTAPNDLFAIGGGNAISSCGKSTKMLPHLFENFKTKGENYIRQIIKQTQHNYVQQFISLKNSIKVPIIYLWHSVRPPDKIFDIDTYEIKSEEDIFNLILSNKVNQFPHLVSRSMVNKIITQEDYYIEYVSSKGFPQYFYNKDGKQVNIPRRNGRTSWDKNIYYPTQEQHKEVADLLFKIANNL